MGEDGLKTKSKAFGDQTFSHLRRQCRSFITELFRVVRIDCLSYQVGIDKFYTVFGQVMSIKGGFTCAISAGQHPELFRSCH